MNKHDIKNILKNVSKILLKYDYNNILKNHMFGNSDWNKKWGEINNELKKYDCEISYCTLSPQISGNHEFTFIQININKIIINNGEYFFRYVYNITIKELITMLNLHKL